MIEINLICQLANPIEGIKPFISATGPWMIHLERRYAMTPANERTSSAKQSQRSVTQISKWRNKLDSTQIQQGTPHKPCFWMSRVLHVHLCSSCVLKSHGICNSWPPSMPPLTSCSLYTVHLTATVHNCGTPMPILLSAHLNDRSAAQIHHLDPSPFWHKANS